MHHHAHVFFPFFFLFPGLFLLFIGGIKRRRFAGAGGGCGPHSRRGFGSDDARSILELKYINGEIDKAEYEEKKNTLKKR